MSYSFHFLTYFPIFKIKKTWGILEAHCLFVTGVEAVWNTPSFVHPSAHPAMPILGESSHLSAFNIHHLHYLLTAAMNLDFLETLRFHCLQWNHPIEQRASRSRRKNLEQQPVTQSLFTYEVRCRNRKETATSKESQQTRQIIELGHKIIIGLE